MMARYFFACFWVILFTGAIRKWMFPGLSVLYLTQDVPIFFAYLYAIYSGLFNRGFLFLAMMIFSAALIFQALAQIVVSGLSGFVAAVGIHHYLFYLPMLVVFPVCLTPRYRRNFVRWNVLFSIPMCLLAVAQAQAPKAAWINKTSEGQAFGVSGAEEVARVSGTFNFVSFYGIWVGMAVALCMGEWLIPKERRVIKNQWLLILCTMTVNLCHLVSASRSTIGLAGVSIIGAMVAAIIIKSSRSILAIGGILFLLPIAAAMTYVISPAEFNIVQERFTGESYQSDTKSRLTEGLVGFITVPKFSFVGAGIGMGVDAAHTGSTNSYGFTYTLSETDIIRNVMELGTPLGMVYVLTRLLFGVGMIFLAIRIAGSGGSPHVVPLSFFLLAQIYVGDLTRNASMTASQVMIGYSFILGAWYYPDNAGMELAGGDSLMRSV